jgi:hypothetical protein
MGRIIDGLLNFGKLLLGECEIALSAHALKSISFVDLLQPPAELKPLTTSPGANLVTQFALTLAIF